MQPESYQLDFHMSACCYTCQFSKHPKPQDLEVSAPPFCTTNHHDSCRMTSSHCTVIAKAICSPLICYRELQQVGNVKHWLGVEELHSIVLPHLTIL
jgi:hypothetical protein